jgi:hypothetical protein
LGRSKRWRKNIYEKYYSYSYSSSSSSSDSLEYLSTIVNKGRYYTQNIYIINIDTTLLIKISNSFVSKIKDFIMYILEDLQMKNSHNGGSSHRVIAVYKLQTISL